MHFLWPQLQNKLQNTLGDQSEGPQFPNVPPFGDLTLLCRRNSSWSDILEAAGLWGDWAGRLAPS